MNYFFSRSFNAAHRRLTSLLLPLLLITLAITTFPAYAANANHQDLGKLQKLAEQYLRTQTAGLPGEIQVSVDAFDARLNLAVCPTPQAFMPNGSRAWGKTTVGVRCTAPIPWTVYVAAQVRIIGEYVAAAAPLAQGQVIDASDITTLKGDLTTLPAGVITNPQQAIGRTASKTLPLGTPLRDDSMRSKQAIRAGQSIRLVSSGPGFSISSEGRAIGSLNEGQVGRARAANGETVSGVARAGGILEVRY